MATSRRARRTRARAATVFEPERPSVRDARPISPRTHSRSDSAVGDQIDLTMSEPDEPAAADDDRHLFFEAQRGLRDGNVRASSRFITTFPAWGPPNSRRRGPVHRARAMSSAAELLRPVPRRRTARSPSTSAGQGPLRARRQGHARRQDPRRRRRPFAATVVLRAVDEKLFSIGAPRRTTRSRSCMTRRRRDPRHVPLASHARGATRAAATRPAAEATTSSCDSVLFQAIDTGADGRGSVTFKVSDDLTSWRVSGLGHRRRSRGGRRARQVPVGLPFFVDASIAPEYLLADRPADPGPRLRDRAGPDGPRHLHRRRPQPRSRTSRASRADAFETVTCRCPS